jgi:hypothetical protein
MGLHPEQARPGNGLAVTHGGTAVLRLSRRSSEIADGLREIVPTYSEADEPTIRLLALVLARIETVNDWLSEHGVFRTSRGDPQPILRSLSTWENTASRLADRLGLTPTSRAALGLDLARAHEAGIEALLERGRRVRSGR